MKRLHVQGFTLIEVSLFLAISGFLVLIVVLGMGPQLKQSEFTDSMQGIAAYINQQYSDIQTGVNGRSNNVTCSKSGNQVVVTAIVGTGEAGTSANCVLLGRQYTFTTTSINAYDVVGLASSSCTTGSSDAQIMRLEKACATKISDTNNTATSYTYSWGNQLQNGEGRVSLDSPVVFSSDAASKYSATNGFGIYRSPDSSQVFTVLYHDASGSPTDNALPTDNINAQFCFYGQTSYPGGIYFGGKYSNGGSSVSGGNNLASVKIDDSSCNEWGGTFL